MRYRIFPPIAVARVGDDPDFLLSPEVPGVGVTEPAQGGTVPATRFKDATSTRIRKPGGLFRTSEDYFHTRRVAIGDGPLSGRIGLPTQATGSGPSSAYYHRVLSL